ncbi:MAG TPA: M48 family metallopeptidase [Candidatus Paceibacterota bacterium]|nr:M48 family metallopeptidase [Candidatus Paceibacterota bacterium]
MFGYKIVYRRRVRRRRPASAASSRKFQLYKEEARALVHALIARLNAHYDYAVRRVFIKNSRSRWGSCSEHGNLNFNYRLLFLPPRLAEYVVTHELCHLKEMNHSPAFWALVEETIPDYKKARKALRRIRIR